MVHIKKKKKSKGKKRGKKKRLKLLKDLPGSPVVSQRRGHEFDPWSENRS